MQLRVSSLDTQSGGGIEAAGLEYKTQVDGCIHCPMAFLASSKHFAYQAFESA